MGFRRRSGLLEKRKIRAATGIRTLKAIIFFRCDKLRGMMQFVCAVECYKGRSDKSMTCSARESPFPPEHRRSAEEGETHSVARTRS
jgi:hypothetical protein